jgi:hypothetical protein
MALVSAGLLVAGSLLPYVSGSGVSISLVDSGGEVHLLFLLPAAIAGVAALVGLAGNALAAVIAAGVVTGMVGPTISILTVFYKLVDQSGGGASMGVGFYVHLAAVSSALSAMGAAWGAARSMTGPTLNQALCTLAALAFVGVPASILLSKDGYSVLDIDDGMIKAGVIGWALIAPAVAIVAVLSGRRGSVALGAGVGIGHLGMVLFMLARDDGAQGLLAGFGVVYEGLHNASVAGAVVLTGLALALTGNDVPAPTTAIGTAGTASPGWAADPFGRHQHRYWDGGQWTSMVSDGGTVTQDPPVTMVPPVRLCPRGHPNPPTGSFCTQCGLPLAGPR